MRDSSIDACKGIGLVLVILGHTSGLPTSIHEVVYSFHMPMFFMLSGLTFGSSRKHRPALEYIFKRIFRLITPAWTMGVICGFPFLIFLATGRRGISPDIFLQKLTGTILGYSKVELNFLTSPLWFLFCLFLIESTASVACKIIRKNFSIFLTAAGIIGMIYFRPTQDLPFGLAGFFIGTTFFGIGIFVNEVPNKITTLDALVIGLASVAGFALLSHASTSQLSTSDGKIGTGLDILTNTVTAFLGATTVYCASKILASRNSSTAKYLPFLGAHGLPIIGFNYWVNSIVTQAFGSSVEVYWIASFLIQAVALCWISNKISNSGTIISRLIDGRWRPH